MAKYKTAFSLSRFRSVAAKIRDGGSVNTPSCEEFYRIVMALLEGWVIVFALDTKMLLQAWLDFSRDFLEQEWWAIRPGAAPESYTEEGETLDQLQKATERSLKK